MKTFDVQTMRNKLVELYDETVRIHSENKKHGAGDISLAFDAGRVDAAKWALELFDHETE